MSDLPTITLAGQPYPVKPLVLRQIRVVQPLMHRVASPLKSMKETGATQEMIDDLIEIVYQAICPAREERLSRDDFMGLAITLPELIGSLEVIALQSGMVKKKETDTGEAPAGS